MGSNWTKKTLTEVCTKIGSGQTPRGGKESYKGGKFALVRSQNVYNQGFTEDGLVYINDSQADQLSNVEILSNDVFINITGDSVARCCMVPKEILPARVNQHVAILRADNKYLDGRFLRYFLISPKIQKKLLSLSSGGATRKALTKSMLESFEIILPTLLEQKAIANILTTLDNKIELNKKTNETLEDISKALFKSWFIDFDPTRAKAQCLSTGLPDEISNLFPDSLESSELGEIPAGWKICPLSNLIDFQNGYAFKSKNWKDSGIPVVKIGSVKPGIVDLSNVSYVDEDIAKSCEEFRLSSGDILIGMTGYVGEVGLVPKVNIAPLLNQRVGKLVPTNTHYKSFVFCLARSTAFRKKVEELSSGSAQANVSATNICSIQLVKPVEKVLEAFASIIDNHLESYLTIHKESEILSSLRDLMLPKLISGDLGIVEAEKIIDEAGI